MKKKRKPVGGRGARKASPPARGRGPGSGGGLLTLQQGLGNRALGGLLGKGSAAEGAVGLLGPKLPPPRVWSGLAGSVSATVYFGQDDFLLTTSHLEAVESLAEQARTMLEPTVVIDSHASTEGSAAYNLRLSKLRRLSVISVLRPKLPKLLKATISGRPYGETSPAVAETEKDRDKLEAQRALNRRVEITLMPSLKARAVPEKSPAGSGKPLDLRIKEWPPRKPGESREEYEKRRREEELSRRLMEPPPRKYERPKFSLEKAAKRALSDGLRKLGVSREWREKIVDAAISGGIKGAKKIVDLTDLGGNTKKAVKALLEAVFKQEF